MRTKYATPAVVLGTTPLNEANALVTLLTRDFGLIRVRAQGLHRPGAKLRSALQTLSEADITLVRGKDGWRLVGALLIENRFRLLPGEAVHRAGRINELLLRLVQGEGPDPRFYLLATGLLRALAENDPAEADAAEVIAALRLLQALGLDAGAMPGEHVGDYSSDVLAEVTASRKDFITRVNRGLTASGL